MIEEETVTEPGAVDAVLTVTVTDAQVVVVAQGSAPSALTKYVVLIAGETVIEGPLPTKVPPQELLYHCQFAPVPKVPPLTVKVVLPPLQIVEAPEIPVGATDG